MADFSQSTQPWWFAALHKEENPAADLALLFGLPEMSPPEWSAAVELILARNTDDGVAGLVGLFESLDRQGQSDLLKRVDRLDHGIRLALRHETFSVRSSAISLILKSGRARFAHDLSLNLTHGCVKTRILCARALEQMVERGLAPAAGGNPAAVTRERKELTDAVEQALETWSRHHRPEVLSAVIKMGGAMDPVHWLDPSRNQSHMIRALGETFRHQLEGRSAGFAWRALISPELRKEVIGTISRSAGDGFWKGMIKEAWLLTDPRISSACRQLHRISWLEQSEAQTPPVADASARHVVRLLVASGVPDPEKQRLLSDWYRFGSKPWRYAVFWACVDISADWAIGLIRQIADDADETLAKLASRVIRRPASFGPAKTHGARPRGAPRDFAEFWSSFESLPLDQLRSTLTNLEEDRRVVERLIRRKWSSSDSRERLRAVRLVHLVGWHATFEDELYRSVHDACEFVRATAVVALGGLPTPTSRRLIMMSLNDSDGRTQANAIEAAAQFEDGDVTRLIEPKLESPIARVRANAVVALVRRQHRPAAETLSAMLHSELPAMRLSGLWAADMLDPRAVADRIKHMAEYDQDPKTRTRASEIHRRIIAAKRAEEAAL